MGTGEGAGDVTLNPDGSLTVRTCLPDVGTGAPTVVGQIVAWFGAWSRKPWLIVSGFVIILYGWFNGLIFPRSEA